MSNGTDWFAANAPKPEAQGGDWFAANAPGQNAPKQTDPGKEALANPPRPNIKGSVGIMEAIRKAQSPALFGKPEAQKTLSPYTQTGEDAASREKRYNDYMGMAGQDIGAVAGGMALAPAVAAGTKGLPWLMRLLARSSGMGIGAGGGSMVGGASPKEAMQIAATTTAVNPAFEAVTALPGAIKKLPETSPGRIVKGAMKPKIEVLSEEHALATKQAEAGYQKELAAHKDNVQAIKAQHQQALTEFKTAGELKTHQQNLAGTVSENLKLADKRISSKIGGKFEQVSDAIEKKVPQVQVTDATREARGKLFFPDSVKAFDNIMENVKTNMGMQEFSVLRKTYSNLNSVLYSGGELPPDLYAAVKTVKESLGKDLQAAATKAGQGETFRQAMRDWSRYQNDWHDTTAAAKGGSQISKILQAEDPQFVIDQLTGKTGQRIINTLKDYGKYGADSGLADRLRTFSQKLKEAPKPKLPETPKIPAPPEKPQFAPFDRQATKEQLTAQRLKKIIGTGVVGAAGAYGYEKMHGGHVP